MGKTTGFLEYDRVNGPVREEKERREALLEAENPTVDETADPAVEGETPVEGEVPAEGEVPVEGETPAEGEILPEGEATVEGEAAEATDDVTEAVEETTEVAPVEE